MAQFTPEQREYIENTIELAVAQMEEQVGSILTEGKAMQDNIAAIVEKHNTELNRNSDRATALVDTAITSNQELAGSTEKIDEAERIMAKLLADLQTFKSNQTSVFADQKAQVDKLTSETEIALAGLDGKLIAAVAGTRQNVVTEFADLNAKLHTFASA